MKKISYIISAFLIISCILFTGCVNQPNSNVSNEMIQEMTQVPITIENESQLGKAEINDPVNRTKMEINASSEVISSDALPWANKFL
ncbi:MAG: hypothetical protein CVV33_07380 [Methanomicrobiales archaeon HGW-Methanomicrobiales-4]|nr:MAG: hypothetical protein CVV33_07380 [Methanomicrobiales archaeon HGW-Methanomicrobiales-4]